MEGKHIFDLIKEFRSASNKILVDYNKFKKWIFSTLRDAKKERDIKNDPKKEILKSLLNKTTSTRKSVADDEKSRAELDSMKQRLDQSMRRGRLTEDLLSEVASFFEKRGGSAAAMSKSPK